MKKSISTRRITRAAVLAALAAVLYALPGIPVITSIYKLDFSGIPVLIVGLTGGLPDALAVLLIKDLTGLLHSSSMGVGELADFLTGAALLLPLHFIAGNSKSAARYLWGSVCGVLAMALCGALVNYFIMIPFYVTVMNFPMEAIIAMIQKVISRVDSLFTLVLYATAPFNLLKGAVLCVLTYPLYRALNHVFPNRTEQ